MSLVDARTDGRQGVLRPPMVLLVAALAIAIYEWAVVFTTLPYPGRIGLNHNTLGTDWMVLYGAIRSVLDGNASLIFDGDRFTGFLNTAFAQWLSKPLEFRPWAYPSSFLLLLLPFAPMGFFGSYLAFQAISAGLMAFVVRVNAASAASAGLVLAIALLSPGAAFNVIYGQLGFLIVALIVGGLGLLETRPVLSGLVLGLLTMKPQFCILVPLALIAAGQWRALWAAGSSALAIAVVSGLVFGWDLWMRWYPVIIENLVNPNAKWIEYGRLWGNSVYACVYLLGAPPWLASAIQFLAIIVAAGSVVLAFRSRLSVMEKTAVLLAATILAAPHCGPYDQVLLVVAAVYWLMAQGPSQPMWCWILVFMIWLVPAVSPPVLFPVARFSPYLTVVLIGLLLRPAVAARETSVA